MIGAVKAKLGLGKHHPNVDADNFYQLSARRIDGSELNFDSLRGRPVLVTNVASKCGTTKDEYRHLGELAQKYGAGPHGLAILAFPCSEFLKQEYSNKEDIINYVHREMSAFQFPKHAFVLMDKVDVNDKKNAHPVFDYLKAHSSLYNEKKDLVDPISWNFGKFLVDDVGQVVCYSPPGTHDIDARLLQLKSTPGGQANTANQQNQNPNMTQVNDPGNVPSGFQQSSMGAHQPFRNDDQQNWNSADNTNAFGTGQGSNWSGGQAQPGYVGNVSQPGGWNEQAQQGFLGADAQQGYVGSQQQQQPQGKKGVFGTGVNTQQQGGMPNLGNAADRRIQ